ncbi:MAG: hypothetical protein KAU41_10255 [Deltaproteobacteria bacterium]|nr:hypothetical protein [Deltaproteobacteria bacterium]
MEPLTVAGIAGVALGSKDVLNKLLGPTAEYLGGEISGMVKKCNINLNSIFVKALHKKKSDSGHVSPRVLSDIIDQGKFADTNIVQDYLAGILAKASDDHGSDDAKIYTAMLDKMSTTQIKLHFLIYSAIATTKAFSPLDINFEESRRLASIFLPKDDVANALGSSGEPFDQKFMDAFYGLIASGLIGQNYAFGSQAHISERYPHITHSGVVAEPTPIGAQLFLWAMAASSRNPRRIFSITQDEISKVGISSSSCMPAIEYELTDKGNGKLEAKIASALSNL